MMKNIIKNYIPSNLKYYLTYLKKWNHNLYSIKKAIDLNDNFSDFFVWNKECGQIEFVAENIRSIISGENIEITHNFRFFSEDGKFIENQKFKTKDFFKKLTLKKISTKSKYISFTHHVESEYSLKKLLIEKGIKNTKNISEQNRGYTIYYPGKQNSGSAVHGNFGGISKNDFKRAKTYYRKHIYTPIYQFEQGSIYDLVFNNPTNKEIVINLIFNNKGTNKCIKIPSLGTRYYKTFNYKGSISFESNLPICRALLFKNPAPNSNGTFDVFHT
tara:strand:+ start:1444 stop:2262 length:819 start_codon:yes stop_codon:yes gene_type:complete